MLMNLPEEMIVFPKLRRLQLIGCDINDVLSMSLGIFLQDRQHQGSPLDVLAIT